MAAILHQRFSDNVVRLDAFARRVDGRSGPLLRAWCVGPDGVLACRWRPAPLACPARPGEPVA